MKKQQGIGLSEVLISLFLASLILMTLIQLYSGCKRQYLEEEKLLAEGFDLQWISELMSDSIRRIGFTPCLSIDYLNAIDHRYTQKRIHSFIAQNQPESFLQVNRMNETFANVIKIENAKTILVENSQKFHPKHPLMIADCFHAEVHELEHIEHHGNQLLLTLIKPLLFSYEASTYVGEFIEERWFIKKNQNGVPSLYHHLSQAQEATPLIHSLHIHRIVAQKKQMFEVILGLRDEKVLKLRVSIRAT